MPRERAYLEWEVLAEAESLTHFADLGPLDPGTHEIRIERDQERTHLALVPAHAGALRRG